MHQTLLFSIFVFSNVNGMKNVVVLLFGITLLLPACKKDKVNPVPAVPVYLDLNINYELSSLGISEVGTIEVGTNDDAFLVLPNGETFFLNQKAYGNGLFIYKAGIYEYYVFDRTCTLGGEGYCALELERGLLGRCPCCSSLFQLINGAVLSGPAALNLLSYRAEVFGSILSIRN